MTDTEAQPPDPSASQPTPAPIAEPVSELPEDAIEAAMGVKLGTHELGLIGDSAGAWWLDAAAAGAVLAAALPFLERATRDKIAAEIGAYPDAPATSSERFKVGFHEMRAVAARVARGGEAATND